jgi:hypothetical protein
LFPQRFGGADMEMLLHWQQRQKRDMALADYIITRDPVHLSRIMEADAWMLEQSTPDIFDTGDPRNVLTLARQSFIKLCAALTEQGFTAPETLTLVAFHGAIDHLSAKHTKGQHAG